MGRPGRNGHGQVTITLPATTDCDADGAICTEDGRMLSNRLVWAVGEPRQYGATKGQAYIDGQVRQGCRPEPGHMRSHGREPQDVHGEGLRHASTAHSPPARPAYVPQDRRGPLDVSRAASLGPRTFSLRPSQALSVFHDCVEGDGTHDQEDGVEGGEDG